MAKDETSESGDESRRGSLESQSQTPSNPGSSKRKSSKTTKPRLSAVQKNTNHKDAENKRRNAIRSCFTDLAGMVPGTQGQERSEQVMLSKTTEHLRDQLKEQRELEAELERRGIALNPDEKLTDRDYGGPNWDQPNMRAYEAAKNKKTSSIAGHRNDQDGDDED